MNVTWVDGLKSSSQLRSHLDLELHGLAFPVHILAGILVLAPT